MKENIIEGLFKVVVIMHGFTFALHTHTPKLVE